jgi:hypothetical protein
MAVICAMKKIMPSLIVFALLLACNSKKNDDDRGGHYRRPVVDPAWLQKQREKDRAEDSLASGTPEKIVLVHLSGHIRTHIICGGAAPLDPRDEPGYEENQLPGSPAHNRRFVLREKKTGKKTEFITNRKAAFSVDVAPGEYELMNGRRGVPDETAFDPNCPEWLKVVLETITIPDTKPEMRRELYFEEACDPCDPNSKKRP